MNNHDFDRLLDSALQPREGCPDLTRSIMGRLGYMQVSPTVARRRRLQRVLGRASLVSVALVVGWLGVMAFQTSPEARRPYEVTMPSAIHSDLQHQQHQFNSLIQLLRQLPPPLEVHEDEVGDMPEFEDDVNRSAVAPVRWV